MPSGRWPSMTRRFPPVDDLGFPPEGPFATVAGVVWVLASVGAAFAGLVVLSVCAFRVFLEVRGLARELERTRRRLEPEQTALHGEILAFGMHTSRIPSRTAYD